MTALSKKISKQEFNKLVRDLNLSVEQAKVLASKYNITESVITCELKTGISKTHNRFYAVVSFKKNNRTVMNPMLDAECVAWIATHSSEMSALAQQMQELHDTNELAN